MTRSRAPVRRAAVLLAGALVLTACGNRVPHEDIAAVGNGYGPVHAAPADGLVPSANTGDADGVPGDPGVAVPGAPAPGAAAPGNPTAPSGTGSTSAPGGATGDGKNANGSPGAVAGGAAPSVGAPCTGSLPPIVLGQTLASSGLVGAAIAGLRTGLAVWAKDVNARGGVQCHPIQLIQLDDASDPARVAANWNSMIKERGAVAVVGGGVPIAMAALRSAAERDRVPVVGGDVTAADWVQSPFLFPTGGAPLTSYDGAVVEAAKAVKDGPAKAGIMYCVEASICSALKSNFPKSVERAGAQLGPVQAVSLTQPDFTSECQTMKSAGVNVIYFGLDGSATIRAARSCASLNYFPVIANGAIAVSAAASADQNLRRNGMYLASGVVPYLTSDTPGAKAFHDAVKRYAPSASVDQPTMLGWASGKLFEAALAKVAKQARAGAVTAPMLLDGLWQLKNERLDGLSPGATFNKGAPAKLVDCYYPLLLSTNGFSAPNGSKPVCFKGNTPQPAGSNSSLVNSSSGRGP